MLALEAAKSFGGKLPLDVLLGHAIRQARDGYVVTKSQARLTAEKLAELKDVPGFAATFLPDGKPPQAGATLKQTALAGDARSPGAYRASTISIAATSDARSPPTSNKSAAR